MSLTEAPHNMQTFFRRNSSAIAVAVIAISLLGIFALQALTIASLSKQVESQNAALKETRNITRTIASNANVRTKQINDINRHLDCIVIFFSQPNRTNKSIDDINTCRISGVSQPTVTPISPRSGSGAGSPQSSQQAPQTQQQRSEQSSAPVRPSPAQPEQAPSCAISLLLIKAMCN